jgi:hypothetical protein
VPVTHVMEAAAGLAPNASTAIAAAKAARVVRAVGVMM